MGDKEIRLQKLQEALNWVEQQRNSQTGIGPASLLDSIAEGILDQIKELDGGTE